MILQLALDAVTTGITENKPPFETITMGNILSGIIAAAIGAAGFYLNSRKDKREAAKDKRDQEQEARNAEDRIKSEIKGVASSFETRVDRLEQHSLQFMPKSEIEKEIGHAKTGASQATSLLREVVSSQGEKIVALQVQIGRIEERHDGLKQDISDVTTKIDKMDDKLDKMQDCLNTLARKA